jgi:S-adenosylmethionine-dependent methyltransferase
MTDFSNFISQYYDNQAEHEWERMDRHRTEYALTSRALAESLPPPPADILDCGSGPGRYAIDLARQGYQVTAFDLSAENLRHARQRADQAGVALQATVQGTATDLSAFEDESFDAVLLMGPLYHLLDEQERLLALREGRRVLKPGGPLLAAFIGRYSGHMDAAARNPKIVIETPDVAERLLTTGKLFSQQVDGPEFIAYMAHPTEVEPLVRQAGLELERLLNLEGLAAQKELLINELEGQEWQTWVELNARVAEDPYLLAACNHLLAVSRKPRWPRVLAEIAGRLDAAGVPYTISGGTAAILHGVTLPFRDVDIETSAEGAYRFQELFPEQVVQPVALSDNGTHRSHFGRFDFEGVEVEIMGDVERLEGETWLPTGNLTEARLTLEGQIVRVSWLEEETLAYIRRGRLDRASQCLRHCSPSRLLALMRGEQRTQVI